LKAVSVLRATGAPSAKLEVSRPEDEFDLTKLGLEELHEMRNRVLSEHPELAEFDAPPPSRPKPSRVLLPG
jgi:hypothetical protein